MGFRDLVEQLCRCRIWFFCRFTDMQESLFHKYIVVIAETYQYLGDDILDCLRDRECVETLSLMVREVMGIDDYYASLEAERIAEVFRDKWVRLYSGL